MPAFLEFLALLNGFNTDGKKSCMIDDPYTQNNNEDKIEKTFCRDSAVEKTAGSVFNLWKN